MKSYFYISIKINRYLQINFTKTSIKVLLSLIISLTKNSIKSIIKGF